MNRANFYNSIRDSLFHGKLAQSQVEGMEAILDSFQPYLLSVEQMAYMLATVFHETARTMQPVEEYGKGKGRKYGVASPPFGKVYYGRGYVQLTWDFNYRRAEEELNVHFLEHPEYTLIPVNAAAIMIKGMTEGWFTGKKLGDYFTDSTADWVNARKIINGLDRAEEIAVYGKKFLTGLKA